MLERRGGMGESHASHRSHATLACRDPSSALREEPIFVAGASGFVGRLLVDALVATGVDVRAGSRTVRNNSPQLSWVPFDLDDAATVDHASWLRRGRTSSCTAWRAVATTRRGKRLQRSTFSCPQCARQSDASCTWADGTRWTALATPGQPAGRGRAAARRRRPGRGSFRASMLIGPGSASWVVAGETSPFGCR